MLRWLTRLFKQNVEAETAPAVASPPDTPPKAASEPTLSTTIVVLDPPGAQPATDRPVSTTEPEPKETCPTCGRASVFAGPPGQRFCTYCALRDELFERSAAAQE